jgi:endonuclease/exonuclease/phosphatase family metal-dependent hydrolase
MHPRLITTPQLIFVLVLIFYEHLDYPNTHRNINDLNKLSESITMVNNVKPKHIILAGDFNCPDIDWSTMTINPKAPEKEVQQQLIDISTEFNLTQVHDTPTRENNLLDIVLTTNAVLVKSSTNIPGLADHYIIITDAIIKPTYNKI